MRNSRIYLDAPLCADASLTLPAETSHYLSKVLRLRLGNSLMLFNGRDGEFAGEISDIAKHAVSIKLGVQIRPQTNPKLELNLGLGLSRGDRMDYAIQKSVELGVSQITPLYTERGEVRLKAEREEKKLRHWQKIVVNACEQSGRMDIPLVQSPCALVGWLIDSEHAGEKLVLDPAADERIDPTPGSKSVSLLIGPEGGFETRELDQAQAQGFKLVSLGPRVLRTETAPVAALAILQYLLGDL